MDRVEFGSDFSFLPLLFKEAIEDNIGSYFPGSSLFFSGRSALYSILLNGIAVHAWETLFIPEYYCHEVTDFIEDLNINVEYYKHAPYFSEFKPSENMCKKGNVILVVNIFGFNSVPIIENSEAIIIEDHTHDLLSNFALNSRADFCFASLRKTIPIPCGGLAWSPVGNKIPELNVSHLGKLASYMKLTAMLLKSEYLSGANVQKSDFRQIYEESEEIFCDHATCGGMPKLEKKFLDQISVGGLYRTKYRNLATLKEKIIDKSIIYKESFDAPGHYPLGLFLKFDTPGERARMQKHLISNNVFPAVLWPNQKTDEAKAFSDIILFLHCDVRYSQKDINSIANIINLVQ